MTQDLTKLSKSELIKLLQAPPEPKEPKDGAKPTTAAAPGASAAPATSPSEAKDLVTALAQALIAARVAATPETVEDDSRVAITLTGGMSVGIEVTDPRTGMQVPVRFERKGETQTVTRRQAQEAVTRYKFIFESGLLSCPDVVPDGINVIHDLEGFLAGLTTETADAEIEKITSAHTLYALFHHIENLRFVSTDEQGNPLRKKDNLGADVPYLKEVALSVTLRTAEAAIARRILEVDGVRVRLNA